MRKLVSAPKMLASNLDAGMNIVLLSLLSLFKVSYFIDLLSLNIFSIMQISLQLGKTCTY